MRGNSGSAVNHCCDFLSHKSQPGGITFTMSASVFKAKEQQLQGDGASCATKPALIQLDITANTFGRLFKMHKRREVSYQFSFYFGIL